MELKDIPVGTYVSIRPGTRYYGLHPSHNPAEEVGIVIRIVDGARSPLNHEVVWLHTPGGCVVSSYSREDLRYHKGALPDYVTDGLNDDIIAKAKGKKTLHRRKEKEAAKRTPEEAVALARGACLKKDLDVTARYAFVRKDGTYEVNNNTACHATVLQKAKECGDKYQTITTFIRGASANKKHITEKEQIAYFHWLLNDSPWAKSFSTKDAKKAWEEKFVDMDLNAPANVVQAGLIATRQPWEHPRVVKMFYKFLSHGLPGNLSFILGSAFGTVGEDAVISFQGAGHFPIDLCHLCVEEVQYFLKGEPHKENAPFNECGDAHGVFNLFEGRVNEKRSCLRTYLKKAVANAGKKTEMKGNIFAAAKPTATESASVEDIADYFKRKEFGQ